MIVFRDNSAMLCARFFAVVMVGLAAGVLPAVAVAQQSGPIRLAPLPPATERPADRNEQPGSRLRPGQVVVEGLGARGEDALGVLGDDSGGLGNDMWAGSRRVDAVRLLRNLPESYPLRQAYELARRVLSTAAEPPRATSDNQGMLGLRVEKLAAIGSTSSALRLINASNAAQVPDHLAGAAVRARFNSGNLVAGCALVRDYTGGYGNAFWQQALIICQVADGNSDQAALGIDLLREQGLQIDPAFTAAALTAAGGGKVKVDVTDAAAPVDVMTFALWLAAKAEFPDELAQRIAPGLLPALVSVPDLDPDMRLAVAHRGLQAGILTGADVVQVYEGLGVSDADMSSALTAPDTVSNDRLLAYLYLAAATRTAPIARSEALWEAWTRGREAGGFDIVSLTTADLLRDVPVTPDFGWLSGVAAEVSLVAGRNRQALDWYRVVLRQAPIVPELARAAAELWPMMRVIGRAKSGGFALTAGTGVAAAAGQTVTPTPPRGPVPWNAARLDRWVDLAKSGPRADDVGTTLSMLEALGDGVDDAQWRLVGLGASRSVMMPDVAILAGLSRAAEDGRKAEAVLYALYALGQSGKVPHANVVAAVVRALDRVGLNEAAQAMAREMAGQSMASERP
ncbi:MAG: hypothetical protein V7788_03100 [Alphaproteobacteria bacterium]|jgi:hypothetical protein